jgi:hypothetical protein
MTMVSRVLDVLYNFHWVYRGEFGRSSQAYAGFLEAFLCRHGVRTMINLRGRNPHQRWWRYESRVCNRIGVNHLDVRLNSRNLPTQQVLLHLIDSFEHAEPPVLIKCSGGQDRASLASALYVVHREGWTALESAQSQFAAWPYMHWPRAQQRWVKAFLPYCRESAGALGIRDWVRSHYQMTSLPSG